MKANRKNVIFGILLFGSLFTLVLAGTPPARLAKPAQHVEVDRLINEQKYAAALDLINKELEYAPGTPLTLEEAQLRVQAAHLQIALHGYETAAKALQSRAGDSPLARFLLQLSYAQSLVTYESSYSWEISQREKVEEGGPATPNAPINLSTATREQVFHEALHAYQDLWSEREHLGDQPKGVLPELIQANTYPAPGQRALYFKFKSLGRRMERPRDSSA